MKHSKSNASRRARGRELNMIRFVRTASHLSLGALVVILTYIIFSGDSRLWGVSAALCGVTIGLIWAVTLSIGCFVMIPVELWRLRRRLERGYHRKAGQDGQVWDRWIDGPDALISH
jgi:hypothetical protein